MSENPAICTILRLTCPRELPAHTGAAAGPSRWIDVPQSRIARFADATDDRQWIHLDARRTQAELGHAPVAHGYLTLSLMAPLMYELVDIANVARIVNYGVNKVRFVAPVLAGDRVRARAQLDKAVSEAHFVRAQFTVHAEVERLDKDAMIAQLLILYFPSES